MKTKSGVIGCVCVCVFLEVSCMAAASNSGSEVIGPKIIKMFSRNTGEGKYRLTCKVKLEHFKEETQVYWLANGCFVEMEFQDVTVKERRGGNASEIVLSKLLIKGLDLKDVLNTTFSCIALSPAGHAQKSIRLTTDIHIKNQLRMNKLHED